MEFWLGLPAAVQALLATGFTYLMTALGASVVFFSNKFSKRMLNAMQGVAAGIMIAASFFSLLLPAQERLSERRKAPGAGRVTACTPAAWPREGARGRKKCRYSFANQGGTLVKTGVPLYITPFDADDVIATNFIYGSRKKL